VWGCRKMLETEWKNKHSMRRNEMFIKLVQEFNNDEKNE